MDGLSFTIHKFTKYDRRVFIEFLRDLCVYVIVGRDNDTLRGFAVVSRGLRQKIKHKSMGICVSAPVWKRVYGDPKSYSRMIHSVCSRVYLECGDLTDLPHLKKTKQHSIHEHNYRQINSSTDRDHNSDRGYDTVYKYVDESPMTQSQSGWTTVFYNHQTYPESALTFQFLECGYGVRPMFNSYHDCYELYSPYDLEILPGEVVTIPIGYKINYRDDVTELIMTTLNNGRIDLASIPQPIKSNQPITFALTNVTKDPVRVRHSDILGNLYIRRKYLYLVRRAESGINTGTH